jgi:adenylyltransferase/sulfurtransferase
MLARYSRQLILPGIGVEGQQRLLASHALVVGAGALGCTLLDQLARAGVGRITIIDRDIVERTNLQRQTLFDEADAAAALPKAVAARNRLTRVNSAIRIEAIIADVSPGNAEALVATHRPDIILDGTDNLDTRYLLNDLAIKHAIPLIYAGVIATRGMQLTILPGRSACLRCVFPEHGAAAEVETCDTVGVLGPAVAIAASLQAAEALRVLAADAVALAADRLPSLTEFDLATTRFRIIDLGKLHAAAARADCPCCGTRRFEFLSGSRTRPAASLCGSGAFQIHAAGPRTLALPTLGSKLARLGPVQANEFFVRLHPRDGVELTVFADARAIIRGVETESEARTLYDRYVGG